MKFSWPHGWLIHGEFFRSRNHLRFLAKWFGTPKELGTGKEKISVDDLYAIAEEEHFIRFSADSISLGMGIVDFKGSLTRDDIIMAQDALDAMDANAEFVYVVLPDYEYKKSFPAAVTFADFMNTRTVAGMRSKVRRA